MALRLRFDVAGAVTALPIRAAADVASAHFPCFLVPLFLMRPRPTIRPCHPAVTPSHRRRALRLPAPVQKPHDYERDHETQGYAE